MSGWVKKTLQYVLFLSIGVALLYLTFKNVNPVDLWNNLKEVPLSGLLLVICIGFVAIVFRGLRWVQMLQSLGYTVHGMRAIAAVAFSYLVNLVTPRVGEVARCTALHRTDKVPIDKLVGTVVLERVVDTLLFGIVTLSTVVISGDELRDFMTQSGAQLPALSLVSTISIAGVFVALLAVVVFTRKVWMQWSVAQKVAGFATGMITGLRSLRTVNNKPLFWLYSIGIWTCYVATIAIGFTIVEGVQGIGPEQAFFVSVAAGLGFVIPVPGGIGAYHYLVSKALVVLGLSPFIGTSFATLIHSSQSLMFVLTGALGFVFLYFAGRK
ncbi:MAG: lysylphosphatidylglycerol synthase transmembrane domain-containing protein [Bacteroidetes bacterium]|nr:lysylphosphatidylglycerol synthase transmembrane domain-containing protein [Bacteroidota bacterium]MDA0898888.1 lysylphosphatidylglycerol synthase transmembrane domain-containing protein [Bacteroidota bacterium]